MESQAYIKNIKISPKKLRFLLPEIKKRKPAEALNYLLYTPKKGARIFYKAIKSAINNAKTVLKVSDDLLKFKLLTVEEGRKLKRFQAGGRGTAKSIIKRYSHIKIILIADIVKPIVGEKPKSQISRQRRGSPKVANVKSKSKNSNLNKKI